MKHVLCAGVVVALLGAAMGCSDDIDPTPASTGGSGGTPNGPGGSGGNPSTGGSPGTGGTAGAGGAAGGAPAGPVVINEVACDGAPEDWIELKNVSNTTADISNWYFRDSDRTHNYTFPAGSTIIPGGYFVIDRGAGGAGPGEFDFGLDNDLDEVHLYDPNDVEMDSTSWAVEVLDPATWARSPDGAGGFDVVADGTKGAANP